MHTLKPRPATPRGWSGGSTAIYFFAGGGRFGASADIGANRSERKKTQDDKCCASHISTGRALCGRSLRLHQGLQSRVTGHTCKAGHSVLPISEEIFRWVPFVQELGCSAGFTKSFRYWQIRQGRHVLLCAQRTQRRQPVIDKLAGNRGKDRWRDIGRDAERAITDYG